MTNTEILDALDRMQCNIDVVEICLKDGELVTGFVNSIDKDHGSLDFGTYAQDPDSTISFAEIDSITVL